MIKKFLRKCLIIGALAMCTQLHSDYVFPNYGYDNSYQMTYGASIQTLSNNSITVNPLFGFAKLKQGKLKNDGWLYGIRGNYDFIPANNIYLGLEIGYKAGDMRGKLKDSPYFSLNPDTQLLEIDDKTKSQYSDFWAEGRIGFNFGCLNAYSGYIAPYFVIGYEREQDDYISPSPLDLDYKLYYGYLGAGLISSMGLIENLRVGVNCKFKWLFNYSSKTGGEDYIKDKKISCGSCFHWSIEIPIDYYITPNIFIGIVPFYEYKNYKRHEYNLEENKKKVDFNMYGGIVQLGYSF